MHMYFVSGYCSLFDLGVSVFGGVGERTREGNDLYMEMKESGVINEKNISESKVAQIGRAHV